MQEVFTHSEISVCNWKIDTTEKNHRKFRRFFFRCFSPCSKLISEVTRAELIGIPLIYTFLRGKTYQFHGQHWNFKIFNSPRWIKKISSRYRQLYDNFFYPVSVSVSNWKLLPLNLLFIVWKHNRIVLDDATKKSVSAPTNIAEKCVVKMLLFLFPPRTIERERVKKIVHWNSNSFNVERILVSLK